jgi:hypothetical protein
MSADIGAILNDWPYEPGQVSARRITGADGKDKLQLRLDLGLLQMETDGRPDGQRPHGHESLLDYYEHLLVLHRHERGSDEGFELDERACDLLRAEGLMYYHRYLAEFILEEFAEVERDSRRNLRLLDFMLAHSREPSDKYSMEQYRPYILMMSTRARARIELSERRPKAALETVKRGIEQISRFYRQNGLKASSHLSSELAILRAMAKEIEPTIPVDPIKQLRRELAKAVREERYEEAAALRDRLRTMGGQEAQEDDAPDEPQ